MSGKIPWLVSLIGSLATAELLLSQRPAVIIDLVLFNIVSFVSVKKTQHSRRQCVASIHQAKEK